MGTTSGAHAWHVYVYTHVHMRVHGYAWMCRGDLWRNIGLNVLVSMLEPDQEKAYWQKEA